MTWSLKSQMNPLLIYRRPASGLCFCTCSILKPIRIASYVIWYHTVCLLAQKENILLFMNVSFPGLYKSAVCTPCLEHFISRDFDSQTVFWYIYHILFQLAITCTLSFEMRTFCVKSENNVLSNTKGSQWMVK